MNLMEKFKHAVYEDEDEKQEKEPVHVASPVPVPTATFTPVRQSNAAGTVNTDNYYERLKAAVSFDQTSIKKILDLATPLESIIPDPITRLKAAFAQARGMGVAMGDIDHDLSAIGTLLKQEGDKFQIEVNRIRASIETGEDEITKKEKELHDLREDVGNRKMKLDRASSGFAAAYAQRAHEIEQLKAQFANIS